MKSVDSIRQLRTELKRIRSGVAEDTIFMAKAILYIAELLGEILEKIPKRKKRKSSAWQIFLGDKLREGKSIKEASKLWGGRHT